MAESPHARWLSSIGSGIKWNSVPSPRENYRISFMRCDRSFHSSARSRSVSACPPFPSWSAHRSNSSSRRQYQRALRYHTIVTCAAYRRCAVKITVGVFQSHGTLCASRVRVGKTIGGVGGGAATSVHARLPKHCHHPWNSEPSLQETCIGLHAQTPAEGRNGRAESSK